MTAEDRDWPLVSIGIPLYRAAEFVENIAANITETQYDNLEFLFSDRHGHDDAIERLRGRFRGDRRVKFFSATDQLRWEGNFNFVLAQASGKYFRWLSQDDRLPVDGIDRLVEVLESTPDAVLAYGPVDVIDRCGNVVVRGRRRSFHQPATWTFRHALDVLGWLRHSAASHGLFRRQGVVDAGLFIRPFRGGLSSRAWRFGLALRGRFCFVASVRSQYRVHPGMFRATNPMKLRYFWDYAWTSWSYLRDFAPSPWSATLRAPAVFVFGALIAPMVRAVCFWRAPARRVMRVAPWLRPDREATGKRARRNP